MAKLITVLSIFLIVLIFKCNSLMPFSTIHCKSIITDMMGECKPYYMDQNSQPYDSCCSAFLTVAFVILNWKKSTIYLSMPQTRPTCLLLVEYPSPVKVNN
ncbi:Lipid transfer protein [Medicago truncatula]|uniref:Lipid transfer protein n=1 Tax=Medicago truncatula TaxID=3880 RepID=A0A072UQG9_MEDTR|nr:Lipid transfer protein [Medicago truncatula]